MGHGPSWVFVHFEALEVWQVGLGKLGRIRVDLMMKRKTKQGG